MASPPGWWEGLAVTWSGWVDGLLGIFVASETEEPPATGEDLDLAVPPTPDAGETMSLMSGTEGEAYPGFDPNG